jgi:hypothetical protein
MRMMPMDANTPATLKKPSSGVIGNCEYKGALKAAAIDSETKMAKPLSVIKMLAIISAICAMLVTVESKLLAVPKYNEKNARDVIP